MTEKELNRVFIEFLIEARDQMRSFIKINQEIIEKLDTLLKECELFNKFREYLENHPEITDQIPFGADITFITDDETLLCKDDAKVSIDIRWLPPKILIKEELKTFDKRLTQLETVK